jgi:FAD/FMN-containing dehydrogenase
MGRDIEGVGGDVVFPLSSLRDVLTMYADYVALQRSWDNTDPRHSGEYLKSGFIDEFPDKLVDTIVRNYETFEDRGTTMFFQHSGGAIGRVPADQAAKTVNRNYQGNYERLVRVKNRYDPTNLFRLNANVRPTV